MGFWSGVGEVGKAAFNIGKSAVTGVPTLGKHMLSNSGSIIGAAALGGMSLGMLADEKAGQDPNKFASKGMIGGAAIGAAASATTIGRGALGFVGSQAAGAVGIGANLMYGLAAKSVRLPTENGSFSLGKINELEFTGLGKTLMMGSVLASGAKEGVKAFYDSRMGQNDGQVRKATPRMPSYEMNAGATGDLVFALNDLKHG